MTTRKRKVRYHLPQRNHPTLIDKSVYDDHELVPDLHAEADGTHDSVTEK